MHPNSLKTYNVILRENLFTLNWGGFWHWIAKWESPQIELYCKWGSFNKWRFCPPFVDHFLNCLDEQIDLQLAMWLVKVGALLKAFLHPSYTTIMNGWSGAISYLVPDMINCLLTMTYSMASITLTCWRLKDEK